MDYASPVTARLSFLLLVALPAAAQVCPAPAGARLNAAVEPCAHAFDTPEWENCLEDRVGELAAAEHAESEAAQAHLIAEGRPSAAEALAAEGVQWFLYYAAVGRAGRGQRHSKSRYCGASGVSGPPPVAADRTPPTHRILWPMTHGAG